LTVVVSIINTIGQMMMMMMADGSYF